MNVAEGALGKNNVLATFAGAARLTRILAVFAL